MFRDWKFINFGDYWYDFVKLEEYIFKYVYKKGGKVNIKIMNKIFIIFVLCKVR